MGHRALVAYERPDELYNLHYSHNGGLHLQLKQQLTPSTPFGGDESDRHRELFARLLESSRDDEPERDFPIPDDGVKTPVDRSPRATHLAREEILTECLSYDDQEAFYVVSSDFEVTAYRTHWFGLQNVANTAEESDRYGNGALRTVRWSNYEPVGDGLTQGEFRALKQVVGDLLDRGVFTHEEAKTYLAEKLDEWTGEHRELIVRTP